MNTRHCAGCNRTKPATAFDGDQARCRVCEACRKPRRLEAARFATRMELAMVRLHVRELLKAARRAA